MSQTAPHLQQLRAQGQDDRRLRKRTGLPIEVTGSAPNPQASGEREVTSEGRDGFRLLGPTGRAQGRCPGNAGGKRLQLRLFSPPCCQPSVRREGGALTCQFWNIRSRSSSSPVASGQVTCSLRCNLKVTSSRAPATPTAGTEPRQGRAAQLRLPLPPPRPPAH